MVDGRFGRAGRADEGRVAVAADRGEAAQEVGGMPADPGRAVAARPAQQVGVEADVQRTTLWPEWLGVTPRKVQAAFPRGGDHPGVNVMRSLWAAVLVAILVSVLVVPTASAAGPGSVVLSGAGGRVTAWPAQHRAELALDGQAPYTFENARIVVARGRITIMGRTPERTLYAWVNRVNNNGAIGVV